MWLCCSLKRCTLGNHERSICVISQTPPMTHYTLLWSFRWKENRKDKKKYFRSKRGGAMCKRESSHMTHTYFTTQTVCMHTHTLKCAHDTHILHYTNRLHAHTHTHSSVLMTHTYFTTQTVCMHTHTLKCAHDTHILHYTNRLHAHTHTHSSVLMTHTYFTTQTVCMHTHTLKCAHDTHILHYTNRLHAHTHTHTHTQVCSWHTHTSLHKPFACTHTHTHTHTHTQVCSWHTYFTTQTVCMHTHTLKCAHDTHILHYTNRLHAHTHTQVCSWHTHTSLHKPFACTHTHSSVLMTHTGVEGLQKCMMGHRNRDPWYSEEHILRERGRGWRVKGRVRMKVADNMHKRSGGARAVGLSQTRWKRRRDILKGWQGGELEMPSVWPTFSLLFFSSEYQLGRAW